MEKNIQFQCEANGIKSVLLDAGVTTCGEIVIVHKITLEKAGIAENISCIDLNKIQNINISEYHPLGKRYQEEKVLTLSDLLRYLETSNLTIFLLVSDSSMKAFGKLKDIIMRSDLFTNRVVLTTKSPVLVYKLRKLHPELVCALWTKKSPQYLKSSTLITSILGAIFRNLISPVIGISFVFINKEEFNL